MIDVTIQELGYLISGRRPRLEVGYLPFEVSKLFGTAKNTVLLSSESARHILEEHGLDISLDELAMLPTLLQQGCWVNDRENHCAVIYFSPRHEWHFRAVVKVTADRQESLLVTLRRSRRKSVKRTFKNGTIIREHW